METRARGSTINRREHRKVRGTSGAHNPRRNNPHRNLTLARSLATTRGRLQTRDCGRERAETMRSLG